MNLTQDISKMAEVLGKLDCTNIGDAEAVSQYMLSNLVGYRSGSKARDVDAKMVAVILQSYAKMLQDSGVTVI